jgi:hypothetical protein
LLSQSHRRGYGAFGCGCETAGAVGG